MEISVWFNLSRKLYEATLVGRGRPIRQDATAEERESSKRLIATGKSRKAVTGNLARALGVKPSELVEVKSRMVYKGRREMPYNKREAVAA